MRPQKYKKKSSFGKESPRRGEPLDRFLKFFRSFYTPDYPASFFFTFDVIRFTRYEVIAEKPREFFHAPCRKNYALDRKMNAIFVDGLDELYRHAKFGGGRSYYARRL